MPSPRPAPSQLPPLSLSVLDLEDFDDDLFPSSGGPAETASATEIQKKANPVVIKRPVGPDANAELELPDSPGSWSSLVELMKAPQKRQRVRSPTPESPARLELPNTPIKQFRINRPVTATDLVGSSWCEIQHLFDLTENKGALFKTQQMKMGTKYHGTLEEEMFQYKDITAETKEDWFAVKLCSNQQGLKRFRTEGQTREITVFGLLGGEVVSGVIDELTSTSPNPRFEEMGTKSQPLDRAGFTPRSKKMYLYETKTRTTASLPSEAVIKSAFMQLRIYHKMLHDMAFGNDIAEQVMARYGVDPDAPLSDFTESELLQEIGQDIRYLTPKNLAGWDGSLTCRHFWDFMVRELHTILPGPGNLSPMLTVAYQQVRTKETLGKRYIMYNDDITNEFVDDKIKMWTGARAPRGVEMEEAFKCQRCRFADICEWRIQRRRGREISRESRL